jgi:hypothetical protein
MGRTGIMSAMPNERSVLARTLAWGGLQIAFFLFVHPLLGNWHRRDTNVYFCFAAFALASLSIVAVLPVLHRVSSIVRVLIVGMLAVATWEFIAAARVFWYQC